MTLALYVLGYVLVIAVLIALNYLMHRWRRGDADEAARREVERFRAFLPPGNENDI